MSYGSFDNVAVAKTPIPMMRILTPEKHVRFVSLADYQSGIKGGGVRVQTRDDKGRLVSIQALAFGSDATALAYNVAWGLGYISFQEIRHSKVTTLKPKTNL